LKPKIICGTSVGAINGLKLAEGEPDGPAKPDANGHVQGLTGLVGIWRSLKYNRDMWKMLDPVSKLLDTLKNAAIGIGAGTLVGGGILGPLGLFIGAAAGARLEEDSVIKALQVFLSTNSLADFYPLQDLMRKRSTFNEKMVISSKIILRMVMTALEDGALRMVDQKGRLLESDGTQVHGAPRYNSAANATLTRIKELQGAVDSLRNDLDDPDREPPAPGQVEAINSLLNNIRNLQASIAGDIIGSKPINVPLRLAALASSSLPVLTPSQEFGDGKNYVDGGTRMVTPIQVALDTGATVVYAVVASCDKMSAGVSLISQKPLSSYVSANIADIAMRVGGDIEPSAINDSQLYPLLGFPVPVLIFRPRYDIHDSLTVAPGLIDIRIDQGWMCADDVMQAWALDAANYNTIAERFDDERHTTWIARYRYRIWIEEFAVNGWMYLHSATGAPLDAAGVPPVPILFKKKKTAALARVRQMKLALRDLVQQRLDAHGNVPPGVEHWWMDWERHTWTPTEVLWPLATMTVKAAPDTGVPLDTNTTIKITATDNRGKAISGATVSVAGKEIGPTGKITTKFPSHKIRVIDPVTHATNFKMVGPVVEVSAPRFQTTPVEIQFAGTI